MEDHHNRHRHDSDGGSTYDDRDGERRHRGSYDDRDGERCHCESSYDDRDCGRDHQSRYHRDRHGTRNFHSFSRNQQRVTQVKTTNKAFGRGVDTRSNNWELDLKYDRNDPSQTSRDDLNFNQQYYRRGDFNLQDYSQTGLHPEVLKLMQKFKDNKPYLNEILRQIRKEGRERELSDDVDNIQFAFVVFTDINADANYGLTIIRKAYEDITEIVRKHASYLTGLVGLDIEEDEFYDSSIHSYKPPLDVPPAPSIETDWNFRPYNAQAVPVELPVTCEYDWNTGLPLSLSQPASAIPTHPEVTERTHSQRMEIFHNTSQKQIPVCTNSIRSCPPTSGMDINQPENRMRNTYHTIPQNSLSPRNQSPERFRHPPSTTVSTESRMIDFNVEFSGSRPITSQIRFPKPSVSSHALKPGRQQPRAQFPLPRGSSSSADSTTITGSQPQIIVRNARLFTSNQIFANPEPQIFNSLPADAVSRGKSSPADKTKPPGATDKGNNTSIINHAPKDSTTLKSLDAVCERVRTKIASHPTKRSKLIQLQKTDPKTLPIQQISVLKNRTSFEDMMAAAAVQKEPIQISKYLEKLPRQIQNTNLVNGDDIGNQNATSTSITTKTKTKGKKKLSVRPIQLPEMLNKTASYRPFVDTANKPSKKESPGTLGSRDIIESNFFSSDSHVNESKKGTSPSPNLRAKINAIAEDHILKAFNPQEVRNIRQPEGCLKKLVSDLVHQLVKVSKPKDIKHKVSGKSWKRKSESKRYQPSNVESETLTSEKGPSKSKPKKTGLVDVQSAKLKSDLELYCQAAELPKKRKKRRAASSSSTDSMLGKHDDIQVKKSKKHREKGKSHKKATKPLKKRSRTSFSENHNNVSATIATVASGYASGYRFPKGQVIGPRDIVVNVGLTKVKMESDYIPIKSEPIDSDQISNINEHGRIAQECEEQDEILSIKIEMAAMHAEDTSKGAHQSNFIVEKLDVPPSYIKEEVQDEEMRMDEEKLIIKDEYAIPPLISRLRDGRIINSKIENFVRIGESCHEAHNFPPDPLA